VLSILLCLLSETIDPLLAPDLHSLSSLFSLFSLLSSRIVLIPSQFFMASVIGIMVADYYLIRRGNIHVPSLYDITPGSLYMPKPGGYELKGLLSWVVGSVIGIPGLAAVFGAGAGGTTGSKCITPSPSVRHTVQSSTCTGSTQVSGRIILTRRSCGQDLQLWFHPLLRARVCGVLVGHASHAPSDLPEGTRG
jgi:hypothetical protein